MSLFEKLRRAELRKDDDDENSVMKKAEWTLMWELNEPLTDELCDLLFKVDKGYSNRIKFAFSRQWKREKLDQLIQETIDVCQQSDKKDLLKSRQLIKHGCSLFSKGQYAAALEIFNQGIILAPFPDDCPDESGAIHFSMCFLYRSRCFKALDKYREACLDVRDAIRYCDNQKIRNTLEKTYSEVCAQAIKEGAIIDLSDLDNLETGKPMKSKTIDQQSVLKNLKLKYSESTGLYAVAGERINYAENFISEEAYSWWLFSQYMQSYCSHCFKPIDERFFPCQGCTVLRFCSSKCSIEAWTVYHSVECPFITVLKYFGVCHITFRAIIITGVDHAIEVYRSTLNSSQRDIYRLFEDTFVDIMMLNSYYENRDDIVVDCLLCGSVYLAYLARSMSLISRDDDDQLIDFGGMLFKLSLIINNCGRFITNEQVSLSIGLGLYSFYGFCAHSCVPNCFMLPSGTRARVCATRPIKEGERVSIRTEATQENMSYEERQAFIKENYFFECTCPACIKKI